MNILDKFPIASIRVIWLGLWVVVVTCLTALFVLELIPLPADVQPVQTIEFSQPSAVDSKIIALPDNWRSYSQRKSVLGRYKSRFDYQPTNAPWAFYIPSFSGQLRVDINGIELNPGGFISGDLIADQGVPFFSTISRKILKKENNIIELSLKPGGILVGFLSQIYVGPAKNLRASYNWHYFRAVQLPILVVFWQVLLALLLFIIWLKRRIEKAAIYCSALLMFSSIHGLPVLFPDEIVLSELVTQFGVTGNFWLSIFGLLFSMAITNIATSIKPLHILVIPVLLTVAFVFFPRHIYHLFELYFLVPISLFVSLGIVIVLGYGAVWKRQLESAIILIAIVGACCLAVHDSLILSNEHSTSNILHFRIVYILILPALSVVFLGRMVQSLNQVDSLVQSLEIRIEEKERQIQQSFEIQRKFEKNQALTEERQRIMKDVHDGLGGQLISIIAMASSKNSDPAVIEDSARAALEELRTMIHSLDTGNDITGILGTFRERLDQQLSIHNIDLEWYMTDIPNIEGLTPSTALSVLRILQEATTNAVKHSGAKLIIIRFSVNLVGESYLLIEITDDGIGFKKGENNGHGLKNMQNRAKIVDGEIEIKSTEKGTTVLFKMPFKAKVLPDITNLNQYN